MHFGGEHRAATRGTLGLVAVMVLVTAAVAISAAVDDPATDGQARASQAIDSVPDEVRAMLGVFRREPTSENPLQAPTAALDPAGDRRPGENPELARRVDLPSGPVYVWPTDEGICQSTHFGEGCTSAAYIRENGVVLGTSHSVTGETEHFAVFGVAVDGVEDVSIALADEREIAAPVRGNVFAVVVRAHPEQVRWRHREQVARQSLHFPSDSRDAHGDGSVGSP